MVRDKVDYIGTMISGFKEVENILLKMAAMSGEDYVSSQNLFQALFNGWINPRQSFERDEVDFSAHQPAEEGLEDSDEEDIFETKTAFPQK